MERLAGIGPLMGDFDAVILDLWGVVHDGIRPYSGVPGALAELRAAGKGILLLSNAPRRISSVAAKLSGMGIEATAYDHIVSSGEVTRDALIRPPDPWHGGLGRKVYHLGPERDADVLHDVPYDVVSIPEEADFVVNTGIDDFDETVADHEDTLQRCRAAELPMVCANPDLVVTIGDKIAICAGMLAARYEDIGGDVRYHGKPYPSVYARALSLLETTHNRVLAVGDSLRTDIAGANRQGIKSVLVLDGIHREEVADGKPVAEIVASSGHRPDYVMEQLAW